MTNNEQYKLLCEQHTDIPLFLQYWWMETVCEGKRWDVLLYCDANGNVEAAMPFLIGKKYGFRYIFQPQLTQYSGIWYATKEFRTNNDRLSFEKHVINKFVDDLAKLKLSGFRQNFPPQFTNWLPFSWHGFEQTTRYTYQIGDLADTDKVFSNFDRNRRQKKILSLQNDYQATTDITPDQFYDFHSQYWKSRGSKDYFDKELVTHLCQTAIARGQGFIMGLADKVSNEIVAMRFVVFDSRVAYSLLSAIKPGTSVNGLSELLFWKVIQELSDKVQVFDFEGSMDEGIEHSYRLYGAEQVPYFQITKRYNPLFWALLRLKGVK